MQYYLNNAKTGSILVFLGIFLSTIFFYSVPSLISLCPFIWWKLNILHQNKLYFRFKTRFCILPDAAANAFPPSRERNVDRCCKKPTANATFRCWTFRCWTIRCWTSRCWTSRRCRERCCSCRPPSCWRTPSEAGEGFLKRPAGPFIRKETFKS